MHCIVLSARYHLQFSIKHMQLNYAQTGKQLFPHNIPGQRNVHYVQIEIVWDLGWAGLKYEVWLDRLELYLNFLALIFHGRCWYRNSVWAGQSCQQVDWSVTAPLALLHLTCITGKPRVSPSLYIIYIFLCLESVISGGKSVSCLGLQCSGSVLISSTQSLVTYISGLSVLLFI